MQDMDSTICTNTAYADGQAENEQYRYNPITKRLIDTRDGKAYWVARLADGNCWMTQNLDYDLIAGKVLTPSDTNVSSDYTIKTTTETGVPAYLSGDANTPGTDLNKAQYTERSWNLGEYVLATPLKGIVCNNPQTSAESPNTDEYNSLRYGDTFERCSDFQNVAGWQPTYQAQTGLWKGNAAGNGGDTSVEGLVAANAETKTYDAHYLIGNYYQFNAATLGWGTSDKQGVNTPRSICPKGWHLPVAGNQNGGGGGNTENNLTTNAFVSKTDSFYNLLAGYGYANIKGYYWNNGNPYTSITNGSAADNYRKNVAAGPLYFTHSGAVHLESGSLRTGGIASIYWSATTYPNATYAYYVAANSTNVYPSNYSNRYIGFSIRCLAE